MTDQRINDEEIKGLINGFDLKIQNSFNIIGSIIDFTTRTQIIFSDETYQQNKQFFDDIVQLLDKDISKAINEGIETKDLINVFQYGYGMNNLSQDLWFKLFQITLSQLESAKFDFKQLIQLLFILDKPDFQMAKDQIESLKYTAFELMKDRISNSGIDSESTNELISLFGLAARSLKYKDYQAIFQKIDEEIALRANELTQEQFGQICYHITNQNQNSASGEELYIQYLLQECEHFASQNLTFFTKDELLSVIGAYVLQGHMKEMETFQEQVQRELLSRFQLLTQSDIVYLLRIYSVSETGSDELFLIFDKFIGKNFDYIEPQHLFPILKSFYDSGKARPKLFIKLQNQVLNVGEQIQVNELCAILRLYSEMQITQTSFYQGLASIIEKRIPDLDEQGFINAIVGFKQCDSQRQLSIVADLEKILYQNLDIFNLDGLAQLLFIYSKQNEKKSNSKLLEKIKDCTLNVLIEQKENGQAVDPSTIMYLLHCFQSLEIPDDKYLLLAESIVHAAHFFSDEDLNMVFEIMSNLQSKQEGFEEARLACKEEIQSRRTY